MTKYTIDFEAWTTIEAENVEDAMSIAQGIINQIDKFVSNNLTLTGPFEMIVHDDGIEEA
jgi:hypothetical protein